MKNDIIYLEGVGYFVEITIDRYDGNGINQPYTIYEPI
jgi:hypothetical protein